MSPTHLATIRHYLDSRRLALDAAALAAYLERFGLSPDLEAAEADFYELIERYEARVVDDFLPWDRRGAGRLVKETLGALATAIQEGRIHGRLTELDDQRCGCLLVHLADFLDSDWTSLRIIHSQPLLVEELVSHVRPGETRHSNPVLALVYAWLLYGLD